MTFNPSEDSEAPITAPSAANGVSVVTKEAASSQNENEHQKKSLVKSELSDVAKLYDVDGDGQLDECERAMRNMDQSNRGYLTNEKVYMLMQEQMETQKQLFRTRRIMFVLVALVFVLAISNLGTSIAAAQLAKDTTTTEEDVLAGKSSNEALSTQTTTDAVALSRTSEIAEDGARVLCSRNDGDVTCDVDSFLSIDWETCRRLTRHCRRGNTVNLSRTWRNGGESSYNVCPFTGTLHRHRRSTLTNGSGKTFQIERTRGEHCRLEGSAVAQEVGEVCELDGDCADGLSCAEDEVEIKDCKDRCQRRRWAQRLVEECQVDCEEPTCQLL